MKENSGSVQGVGGLELYYRTWLPEKPPRGVVAIVHGVGEHTGRYQNLANALVPAGYIVTGFDQRGHGRSEGQRGHIMAWEEYREDMRLYLAEVAKLAPGLPLFLYGHSMGTLVMPDYLLHYPDGFAGAILSGTAIDPKDSAPAHLVAIARVMSRIKPNFSMKIALDGSFLSRDQQVANAYNTDPLVHWQRSARWGTEFLDRIEWLKENFKRIELPVQFLHGECDPVVSVEGARRMHADIWSKDKTIHIYPEGLHEPHNDIQHEQVGADIRTWLDAHLK
jgi:alpha-beta hydrolase superfamily lysophospholipase